MLQGVAVRLLEARGRHAQSSHTLSELELARNRGLSKTAIMGVRADVRQRGGSYDSEVGGTLAARWGLVRGRYTFQEGPYTVVGFTLMTRCLANIAGLRFPGLAAAGESPVGAEAPRSALPELAALGQTAISQLTERLDVANPSLNPAQEI